MIERKNAQHYVWGDICEGWNLLKTDELSIIEERIPPGGSETRHHHQRARQFFYILSGVLSFEIDGKEYELTSRQGIEIGPSVPHCVFNRADKDVEFLVISCPPTHTDRVQD